MNQYIPFDFSYILVSDEEASTTKNYPSLNVYAISKGSIENTIDDNISSSGYVYDSTTNSWKDSSKVWRIEYNDIISSWVLKRDADTIEEDGTISATDNGYFYLKNSINLEVPYVEETSASFNYYTSEQSDLTSAYWTKYKFPDGMGMEFSLTSSLYVSPIPLGKTITISKNIDIINEADYPDLEDLDLFD